MLAGPEDNNLQNQHTSSQICSFPPNRRLTSHLVSNWEFGTPLGLCTSSGAHLRRARPHLIVPAPLLDALSVSEPKSDTVMRELFRTARKYRLEELAVRWSERGVPAAGKFRAPYGRGEQPSPLCTAPTGLGIICGRQSRATECPPIPLAPQVFYDPQCTDVCVHTFSRSCLTLWESPSSRARSAVDVLL